LQSKFHSYLLYNNFGIRVSGPSDCGKVQVDEFHDGCSKGTRTDVIQLTMWTTTLRFRDHHFERLEAVPVQCLLQTACLLSSHVLGFSLCFSSCVTSMFVRIIVHDQVVRFTNLFLYLLHADMDRTRARDKRAGIWREGHVERVRIEGAQERAR